MASRESSTRRKPDSDNRQGHAQQSHGAVAPTPTRGNSTSQRNARYMKPPPISTTTPNRNPSPPKSKPSGSSPVVGDPSFNLLPSNSTRHHSSTRVNTSQTQNQTDRDRHRTVQTSTQRSTDPRRRPSTRDTGGSSSRDPENSRKGSTLTPVVTSSRNGANATRVQPTAYTSRGLARKDTGARREAERDLTRHNSEKSSRDLSRNDSGKSSRDLSRHDSGKSSRDLARSRSGRRDIQTSRSPLGPPRPQTQTRPASPQKPLPNPYYKPFTPFKPIDQVEQGPRVRYEDGARNERPVGELGEFLDRDKLMPMTTGSTSGWIMVPNTGSIMVCSKCRVPVNPFRPKKSHKSCR